MPEHETRTAARQWALEVLGLAKAAMDASPRDVDLVELPDRVREAIDVGHRLTAPVARQRQRRYVAGLLRLVEEYTLEELAEAVAFGDRGAGIRGTRAERWLARLLDPDDGEAVTEFVAAHQVNVQRLRQLVRQAVKGTERGKRRLRELVVDSVGRR